MRRITEFLFALVLIILLSPVYLSAQNSSSQWEVAWDVPLFKNSSGGVQSVSRDETGWIRKVTGSYGEALKGQKVHKVHLIREQRMLVTLDDKRKGWIDLPFLWPPANTEAYLLQDIKFHNLKAEPSANSKQAVDIDPKRRNKRFHRNTRVTLSRWYTDKDKYDKFKTAFAPDTWAYITIDDEAKGWIPLKYIRLDWQMHDNAKAFIWKPIRWISKLLGDGFWAGLIVILLYPIQIGRASCRERV